jgi:hypothetical protein
MNTRENDIGPMHANATDRHAFMAPNLLLDFFNVRAGKFQGQNVERMAREI